MTKGAALYAFFNGFGIPDYTPTSVPENASMPYMTHTPVFDSWDGGPVSLTVNLWYRSESEAAPNAKAQELSDAIGGGKYLPCDGGAILLTRGSPFCQALADDTDIAVKRRYINITAQFITLN